MVYIHRSCRISIRETSFIYFDEPFHTTKKYVKKSKIEQNHKPMESIYCATMKTFLPIDIGALIEAKSCPPTMI